MSEPNPLRRRPGRLLPTRTGPPRAPRPCSGRGGQRRRAQTCVVHLLRASFRSTARKDWDTISKALKAVYTAPTQDVAEENFLEFCEAWGSKYPAIVKLWENAVPDEFTMRAAAGDGA
jgi:hypothetical protein